MITGAGPGPAQPASPAGPQTRQGLPTALWIGTAIFAVLAAGALFAALRLARERSEASARDRIEKQAVEVSDQQLDRIRVESAVEAQMPTPAPAAGVPSSELSGAVGKRGKSTKRRSRRRVTQ